MKMLIIMSELLPLDLQKHLVFPHPVNLATDFRIVDQVISFYVYKIITYRPSSKSAEKITRI